MPRKTRQTRIRTKGESELLSALPMVPQLIIWLSIIVLFGGAVAIAVWIPAYAPVAWGLIVIGMHTSFSMLRSRS